MYVAAIVAAAGRGRRLGAPVPKQLLAIGGRTILERAVAAVAASDRIDEIVVAAPPELAIAPEALPGLGKPLRVVAGGERRQDSVARAFEAVSPAADVIVIHDAARPFVSAALLARTIDAAVEAGAAVAAVPARDTVKRTAAAGETIVQETIPREVVYLAQTPQAFRRDVLRDALALGAAVEATDEATLAERAGHVVRLVPGEEANIKITTAADLAVARALAGETPVARTGLGYDLHRLVEGRSLRVGGVLVPSERGAAGHSDGDAVCHALADAVLGAACAGDIGRLFPDTDPRWKDADSVELLRAAVARAAEAGFVVESADVVVILERPRLAPYLDAMRRRLADALGVDPARVSVKGKSNEGVDAVGRGEAVAAHAVAVLRPRPAAP
jgi:2-C-methyl-D-erythritol 4-phosphate cytidylyltransferase/2-C-methyl-D-erythritol 2,4-cyclodiphosphate synthase